MTEKDQQVQKPLKQEQGILGSEPRSATQLLVITGLLTALVFAVTHILGIRVPDGYLNLGDSSIAASALLLSHPLVALAAGLGSALSNMLNGLWIFAPATFVIKGAMGYVLYLFARRGTFAWFAVGVFLAELIMVVGYTAYIFLLVDIGSIASIPGNLVQAAANFALALLLYVPLMALRKALWGNKNTDAATEFAQSYGDKN